MVNCGEPLELTKLSEYGPYSEGSFTILRVPPLFAAPVQGEEEHGPPPGTVLVSVRKEGNTPPCMKPLAIRLTVPVHRASPEGARRYAMCDGGLAAATASVTASVTGGRPLEAVATQVALCFWEDSFRNVCPPSSLYAQGLVGSVDVLCPIAYNVL